MVSVEPGPVITLTTSGGRKVLSRKVILTTGGWGKRLLGQLDLTVPLQVSPVHCSSNRASAGGVVIV